MSVLLHNWNSCSNTGQESRLNPVAGADSRICRFGSIKTAGDADQTMETGRNTFASGVSPYVESTFLREIMQNRMMTWNTLERIVEIQHATNSAAQKLIIWTQIVI